MFVIINESNQYLVESFIANAGDSLRAFRYFSKYSLSVLQNHLITLMIVESGKPICYGHLDRDNEKVWLGIAVIDSEVKKGWGKKMMNELIKQAKHKQLNKIFLSVDNDNFQARALYESYGFQVHEDHPKNTIYVLELGLDFAVSTIAFMGRGLSEAVRVASEENFKLEFSSGVPYSPKNLDICLQAPVQKLLHNYFPPPAEPFVLNLASKSEDIRERSINHCIQGLELSAEVGAPFFSAHAGFCVDPDCAELGKKFETKTEFQRPRHWQYFIDALKVILTRANELGVSFLVENNVLAPMNLREDGVNPFLCADINELMQLAQEVTDPFFGLLIDTGHLKVSSYALDYSIDEAIKLLAPYTRAMHHSDNNGREDTNDAFDETYWFLPYVQLFKDAVHVLEVKKQTPLELKKQMIVLNHALVQQREALLAYA